MTEMQRGRRPHEDEYRDWSDAATSQGMPGVTRRWKRHRILSQSFQREMALPVPWFQTSDSRAVREQLSLVLSHHVRGTLYSSPGKLIHSSFVHL